MDQVACGGRPVVWLSARLYGPHAASHSNNIVRSQLQIHTLVVTALKTRQAVALQAVFILQLQNNFNFALFLITCRLCCKCLSVAATSTCVFWHNDNHHL